MIYHYIFLAYGKTVPRFLPLLLLLIVSSGAFAQPLDVVASVRPLALLVSDIGGEGVRSQTLLPPGASPHDYQFKASEVRRLMSADVVFWVGPELEQHLARPMRRHKQAQALQPALKHGDDPHVWLDLALVQGMVKDIAEALSRRQPTRSAYFHANAARLISVLRQYDKRISVSLGRDGPASYLLVHDGFSRFESRYRLGPGEVLMKSEHQLPGARHVAEVRARLLGGQFECVFTEAQSRLPLLDALLDGVEVPVKELDYMGVLLPAESRFIDLYRSIAEAYMGCAASAEAR